MFEFANRLRWMSIALLLLSLSLAEAQYAGEASNDTGRSRASVSPELSVELKPVVELRLSASQLSFDLRSNLNSGDMSCVYANEDIDRIVGSGLSGQEEVFPVGTSYQLGTWSDHPTISINGNGQVQNYVDFITEGNGNISEKSFKPFVCYRSFVMRVFSNLESWQLTVERNDPRSSRSIDSLYLRTNHCSEAPSAAKGLYRLADGASMTLRNQSSQDPDSDFCEHLGVVAVKVMADPHGTSTAHLTYTLAALDPGL